MNEPAETADKVELTSNKYVCPSFGGVGLRQAAASVICCVQGLADGSSCSIE
jgi:hypothetical protein